MELRWTHKAVDDLERLHEFLAPFNQQAAAKHVQSLVNAPSALIDNPRLGEQLFQFEPREIRRIFVDQYEIRYEVQSSIIYILRIWHTREHR